MEGKDEKERGNIAGQSDLGIVLRVGEGKGGT